MNKILSALFAALVIASTAQADITVQLSQGFSIVGNPLRNNNNLLRAVLPDAPIGAKVYLFTDGTWNISTKLPVGWSRNFAIPAGYGFFLYLPQATHITFHGESQQGALVTDLTGGGSFQLVASGAQTPLPLGYLNARGPNLGFPAANGDKIFVWDGSVYRVYTFAAKDGWVDSDGNASDGPIIPVGGGFWAQKPGFSRTWVQAPAQN